MQAPSWFIWLGTKQLARRVPERQIFSKFAKFAKNLTKLWLPLPGDGCQMPEMSENGGFSDISVILTPCQASSLDPGQINLFFYSKPLKVQKTARKPLETARNPENR